MARQRPFSVSYTNINVQSYTWLVLKWGGIRAGHREQQLQQLSAEPPKIARSLLVQASQEHLLCLQILLHAASSADLQLLRDPLLVQAIGSPVRNISQAAGKVDIASATQDLKELRSLPER